MESTLISICLFNFFSDFDLYTLPAFDFFIILTFLENTKMERPAKPFLEVQKSEQTNVIQNIRPNSNNSAETPTGSRPVFDLSAFKKILSYKFVNNTHAEQYAKEINAMMPKKLSTTLRDEIASFTATCDPTKVLDTLFNWYQICVKTFSSFFKGMIINLLATLYSKNQFKEGIDYLISTNWNIFLSGDLQYLSKLLLDGKYLLLKEEYWNYWNKKNMT